MFWKNWLFSFLKKESDIATAREEKHHSSVCSQTTAPYSKRLLLGKPCILVFDNLQCIRSRGCLAPPVHRPLGLQSCLQVSGQKKVLFLRKWNHRLPTVHQNPFLGSGQNSNENLGTSRHRVLEKQQRYRPHSRAKTWRLHLVTTRLQVFHPNQLIFYHLLSKRHPCAVWNSSAIHAHRANHLLW